jgi:hypothetical protein
MFLRSFINCILTLNDIPYGVIYSTDQSATSTLTIEVSNSAICVVLLANMVHIFYIWVDGQSSIEGLMTWHHTVCCKMLVNSQKHLILIVVLPHSCVKTLLLVDIPCYYIIQINGSFSGSRSIIRNIRIIKESRMNKVQLGVVYVA